MVKALNAQKIKNALNCISPPPGQEELLLGTGELNLVHLLHFGQAF